MKRNWKRILSFLLVTAMLAGMMAGLAQAADSEEEAMSEIPIYNGGQSLACLAVNGRVQDFNYVYYLRRSGDGSTKEIPTYCVNPTDPGVPQKVPVGSDIKYIIKERESDPKVMGIVANGYPTKGLDELGLNDKVEGYYATKIALWCYIIPGWNISNVTVNPAAADQAQAQRVLTAAKKIYDYGTAWTEVLNPGLTVSPGQPEATLTTIDGQQYKEQTFTVHSETFVGDYAVNVSFKEPGSVPSGTRIVNMDNQDITTITMEGSGSDINGQFKVLYPLESVEGQSGSDQIWLSANTYQYGVFYASCAETDTYGTVQNYMCDTDPTKPVDASVISKYSNNEGSTIPDDEPDKPSGGKTTLKIVKLEEGTKIPLEGAIFEVEGPDGDTIGSFSTGPDGTVTIPVEHIGSYVVTEITPPKHHLLPAAPTQTVSVSYGRIATVTFENAPYGNLRVEKVSDTGDQLTGVTVQVKHIESGTTYSAQTGPGGAAVFEKLKPGAYEVSELAGIEGWKADTDTVKTVSVVKGETATTTLTNKELPGLRILKYDRQTMTAMKNVSFEIYKDGELFDTKSTNEMGEILLTNLQPGTYRVVEVDTGDTEHVLDPNAQELELHAGDGIKDMVFFNSKKPGIRLVKVDSVTMKPLPNVRFEIKQVGGSYQKEFTTGLEGEIDLSKLEPGSYEVRELAAPDGYLIDDAVRVIQLNPDETAEFVFTNTPKPKLRLIKTSSDGTRLGGVHFRIAKIEDGSHYLDRVTEAGTGEINIENLEPGVYSVKETATTADHILDVREYHVELFPGKTSTLTIENQRRSGLTIRKTDKDTGEPIPGVTFTLRFSDGHTITTEPTGPDGTVRIENLLPGVYTVTEQSVPESYLLDKTPQQVTMLPNRDASVQFQNYKRPTLKIAKVDINGKPLTGAIFEVKTKAGVKIGDFPVGPDGTVTVPHTQLAEGYYIITERQAPEGYILDSTPREVYLRPGKTTEISIENEKKPGLTIVKIDSVVGDGIKGAKFELWVSKDKTENGTYQKLNDTFYYTGDDGTIELPELDTGWYKVKEVEPAEGYMLKEPSEQTLYVEHDKGSTITFENIPKSALVIRKIDADTGAPLVNAWFRVRYLGGTSGSGGTIVGEYQTSNNGNIVITNLEAGTYVCEEISAPNGYVMDTAPQTAYISGKQQDCITLTFTNSKFGSLLVKKVDSVTGSPISGVQFFVTTSDGNILGNSNGYFTTDSAGTILISDVQPGTTLVVKETRAKDGYLLDETPQTVKIQSNETMTLEFRNQPLGSLLIRKVCSVNPSVTLPNAEFKVAYSDGTLIGDSNGVYRTDETGEIRITGLTPGKSVVAAETRAPAGFLIDTQSQTAQIKEGKTVSLTFKNQPKGGIIIQKRDRVTGQPLPGAQFRVTTAAGCEVGLNGVIGTSTLTQNGIFTSGPDGEIRLSNLAPGAYVLTEIKAPEGYVMDAPSTNVVVGANGDTQTVVITNTPKATLTILKRDAVTRKPLAKAEFEVRDSEGRAVGPNNGRYTTGTDGTVTVSGLEPGATIVVSEAKAPTGYILDETPKSIVVKSGVSNSLTFDDEPGTTLIIHKYIEGTKNEPLSGVAFKVVDGSGAAVGPDDGVYYTDQAGEIVLDGIEPGTTVTAREIKTVEGYVLDGTPQDILIKAGEVQNLTFWNKKAGTLVIQKKDSVTGALISGAQFQVTYANGGYVDNDNGHLSSNGLYTTDDKGEIRISGVTGTVVVKETKPAPGYVIDQSTQTQTVTVNPLDTQTLTFLNEPLCSLTLTKLDSVTGKPIPGTEFTVKDGNGTVLGRYTTGKDGTVVVTGLVPGSTVVVTETKVPDGYVLNPTPQTIIVKNGSNSVNSGTVGGTTNGNTGGSTNVGGGTNGGNDLVFENDPIGTFELIKVVEGNKEKRIPNVTFEIRRASDDALVETVTTGSDGRVTLKLDAGDYYAVETEAAKGFKLDATRHYFTMKNGKNTTLTVTNKALSGILIHKTNSVTGKGIQGVTFLLYDSSNNPIGQYTSDNSGYVYIEDLTTTGRFYLKELENEGYVPDTQMKTVYVTAGQTTLVEWKNIPITAQIQIIKKSADYNSTNGLPAGTLLEGAVFEIYDKANNLVDTIKSDQRGLAASKPLPLGRYTIREVKAPANYGVSDTVLNAYLEHEGQIVTFEVTNKALSTGVNITKTGPKEAMSGQPVRYQFSGIANRSNVRLDNFYWRDTLPAEVRLNTVVTGTYNFPGTYKITYRVNGGEPRTLADSLSTSQNYTLAASNTALGLASNERVTEIMFVFGQAPAGFAQVETPYLHCTAVSNLKAASFVNVADVGGSYNGVWVQGVSRWVTTVYGKPNPLPKTGY